MFIALAERMKISCGTIDAAKRNRRNVGAYKHQIGAKVPHQIELALSPIKGSAALRFRHAFKISEWLEKYALQTEIANHFPHIARRTVEGEEVALEYLNAVETSRRYGHKLFLQVSADRHCGN